jgi:PAS domain S-box-containing protein
MPTNRAQYRPREYLRLIFRQAPGAVWATDRDLRLTHVQGRTGMLDEAESLRLVGTTIHDFVGSRDPSEPVIAHHLAALVGGRQSFQYLRHSRWFEVLIEPLLDDSGTIVGCVGAAMDITTLRETTQQLHRSVSLLQATLNATADGILVVDRQGQVATCNQRFLTLWRVPPTLAIRGDDAALLSFVSDQLDDSERFLSADDGRTDPGGR